MLTPLFFIALSFFSGTYLIYFLYVKKCAKKLWGLKIDYNFEPNISILVPAHNEEDTIELKLENIKNVSYPKEKMEIIVANDASNDDTAGCVKIFAKRNPELNITLINQDSRAGKSETLNKALTISTSPIVIVSDADTSWPSDILQKALPYLSDPRVGAVTGWGIIKNVNESWVAEVENMYLHIINLLRLGESKIHSTIRFEGGFCAYKRSILEGFDCETGSDDSGTALKIIQKGYRTILIPEAFFYTDFPANFVGKLRVKVRRANQLIGLWFKCLKLLLKGQLLLPKKIAVPEIILFILNPLIFLLLVITGAIVILNSLFPIGFAVLLITMLLVLFARRMVLEIVVDQLVLLYALITFMFKKRYTAWEKPN